jgi:hypothetical protein
MPAAVVETAAAGAIMPRVETMPEVTPADQAGPVVPAELPDAWVAGRAAAGAICSK